MAPVTVSPCLTSASLFQVKPVTPCCTEHVRAGVKDGQVRERMYCRYCCMSDPGRFTAFTQSVNVGFTKSLLTRKLHSSTHWDQTGGVDY